MNHEEEIHQSYLRSATPEKVGITYCFPRSPDHAAIRIPAGTGHRHAGAGPQPGRGDDRPPAEPGTAPGLAGWGGAVSALSSMAG